MNMSKYISKLTGASGAYVDPAPLGSSKCQRSTRELTAVQGSARRDIRAVACWALLGPSLRSLPSLPSFFEFVYTSTLLTGLPNVFCTPVRHQKRHEFSKTNDVVSIKIAASLFLDYKQKENEIGENENGENS